MNPVDALWDVADAVGKAIGDGMTLAAEILCPRDHTAEDRLRSWESAAEAVEDEICDEADACDDPMVSDSYLRYDDTAPTGDDLFKCAVASCGCQDDPRYLDSAAVSAAADPSPAETDIPRKSPCRAGFIHADARCARPYGHDGPHVDWDGQWWPESEATDPESDPGEVAAPSPGEQVREDDLTAHIMGDFVSGQEVDPLTATLIDAISSHIARCLLADFHITRN